MKLDTIVVVREVKILLADWKSELNGWINDARKAGLYSAEAAISDFFEEKIEQLEKILSKKEG